MSDSSQFSGEEGVPQTVRQSRPRITLRKALQRLQESELRNRELLVQAQNLLTLHEQTLMAHQKEKQELIQLFRQYQLTWKSFEGVRQEVVLENLDSGSGAGTNAGTQNSNSE